MYTAVSAVKQGQVDNTIMLDSILPIIKDANGMAVIETKLTKFNVIGSFATLKSACVARNKYEKENKNKVEFSRSTLKCKIGKCKNTTHYKDGDYVCADGHTQSVRSYYN